MIQSILERRDIAVQSLRFRIIRVILSNCPPAPLRTEVPSIADKQEVPLFYLGCVFHFLPEVFFLTKETPSPRSHLFLSKANSTAFVLVS